ncbi:uncharacterized protein LOC134755416 [Cydia strobilella]|uniref:uncharacterized protein LOC134755416 n=1 Tax=Cydia strobilella TaxID=1100964 RepID=UPI0030071B8C
MIPTRSGNKCLLMLEGYTYSQINETPHWCCSSKWRGCKARLRRNGDVVLRIHTEHTHPPPKYVTSNSYRRRKANTFWCYVDTRTRRSAGVSSTARPNTWAAAPACASPAASWWPPATSTTTCHRPTHAAAMAPSSNCAPARSSLRPPLPRPPPPPVSSPQLLHSFLPPSRRPGQPPSPFP